ncbi:hypothetical protein B9Z65_7449 [Elsinoe australis]|uniref:Uncharacterized protein n=1 Tax=Elsinoe australis TaxID=40998 RepID=A0A2P7YC80_9PEZI|nr:hypothetical protein B9Z65_7449 [Elsinoe australis]
MAPFKADGDFAKDPPPPKSWYDFATFIEENFGQILNGMAAIGRIQSMLTQADREVQEKHDIYAFFDDGYLRFTDAWADAALGRGPQLIDEDFLQFMEQWTAGQREAQGQARREEFKIR